LIVALLPAHPSQLAPGSAPESYYRVAAVRERILEYAGGGNGLPPSCRYFAALFANEGPLARWEHARRYPPGVLDDLLAESPDVARSAWDARSLLVYLDIDYLNVDYPGEAFLHPADVFLKLEPVYLGARRVARRFGLGLMYLMTGRGYHLVGRIPLEDPLVTACADLVPEVPAWHRTSATRVPSWTAPADVREARAWVGLGLLLEFLAHAIVRASARRSVIPVVLNGTQVGETLVGRECISLDLSHAGDPQDVRHLRCAFSTYRMHRFRPDVVGDRIARHAPPLVALPRDGEPLLSMLRLRQSTVAAAAIARRCRTHIPVVTSGLASLLADYRRSSLASFHRGFYATPLRQPETWSAPEVEGALGSLPPCAAASLRCPNDLLLQPAHLQHVTRVLMSRSWAPRRIASLVGARYASDSGWGDHWQRVDPTTRADFDVRVFAGAVVAGLDGGVDFNCTSTQEKQMCPTTACSHDLRLDRERLCGNVRS
jgi:hypothetical protein